VAQPRSIGGLPVVIFRVWGAGKTDFILESAKERQSTIGSTTQQSLRKLGETLVSKKATPWMCSLNAGEALIVPAGYVSW